MISLDELRVFTNDAGGGGNPLGVVLNAGAIRPQRRQALAAESGFAELVFVNDLTSANVQIFTPRVELPFAGHPVVGTSWLIAQRIGPTPMLRPAAGEVPTWQDGPRTWIRGRPEWAPPFELVQVSTPVDVEALAPTPDHDLTQFWAWQNQAEGRIRARVFASRNGVVEDEACGAASMLLADSLRRPVTIHHGEASVIYARPGPDGTVDLGGAVVLVETREL